MLLVDPTSGPEPFIPQTNGRLETDPYSYPHGLTPPLKHVRQRRFRKKLSKRAIEEVEREVERLLEIDATAEDVQYGKNWFYPLLNVLWDSFVLSHRGD
jgi:transcription initiation factor TFIID subunit 7